MLKEYLFIFGKPDPLSGL